MNVKVNNQDFPMKNLELSFISRMLSISLILFHSHMEWRNVNFSSLEKRKCESISYTEL